MGKSELPLPPKSLEGSEGGKGFKGQYVLGVN